MKNLFKLFSFKWFKFLPICINITISNSSQLMHSERSFFPKESGLPRSNYLVQWKKSFYVITVSYFLINWTNLGPLATFLDYITYGYMIDNIVLLITGTVQQYYSTVQWYYGTVGCPRKNKALTVFLLIWESQKLIRWKTWHVPS